MGTKATKSVFDSLANAFNAVFAQNGSNEFIQAMVPADSDGNLNSATTPVYSRDTGVTFVEPVSFQTNASLGIGANYTTAIEDALSQPNLQIDARGSHAYTVAVLQYRDSQGTKLMQTNTFTRTAGVQLLENMQITGNYVQIIYTNTSGAVMTETMLYASLGQMPLTLDQLGIQTSAKSMSMTFASDLLGQKASAGSAPMVLANDASLLIGTVLRGGPTISANAVRNASRLNQFLEPVVTITNPRQLALENTFGVAPINPTIGTAVALGTATQTAYVGTAPSILVRNVATANGKDVYINAIELSLIGAGTGLTDLWIEVHIDTVNRYTSGGTAITPKTLYSQSAVTAITPYVASTAIVASADTATFTRLFRRRIRTVAPVAGDVYKVIFDGVYDGGSYALNSTVPGVYNVQAPVCVIPPVGNLLIYIYASGMTVAPTWEGNIEFTER